MTGRPVDGQAATEHHSPDHARSPALEILSDPALTGMSRQELDALTTRLAPAQAAQTEQRCYQQRGGRRRRAPGAGSRPLLDDADRILITIIYLRQVCSQKVMSEMLEVNPTSIGQAIAATRRLLEEHRHAVTPTMLRFSHPNDLLDYLDHGITVSRPRLPEVLSDPALTGISRQELQQLTERLALRQAAQTERRRHKRRGRQRLPGTEEPSSGRRSPTPSESWQPSCPNAESAPGVSWPSCSTSARAPSATRSWTSARSWNKTATPSPLPDDDSLPRQRFWTS